MKDRIAVFWSSSCEELAEQATPQVWFAEQALRAAAVRAAGQRRVQRLLEAPSRLGRCDRHGCMLQAHVLKSGAKKGSIRLYCRRWFEFRKPERRCWFYRTPTAEQYRLLPESVKKEYSALRASFARGGR